MYCGKRCPIAGKGRIRKKMVKNMACVMKK